MATVLYGTRETDLAGAVPDDGDLWIPAADLPASTGWERKPEGLCTAERCVPVPPGQETAWEHDGRFNLSAFARHLDQPVAADEAHGIWSFGAEPGALLQPGDPAPDFTLPDLDGKLHALGDYRGRKVLLVTWASW
jgi:hypothetical protein